jgi:hypothetical protein
MSASGPKSEAAPDRFNTQVTQTADFTQRQSGIEKVSGTVIPSSLASGYRVPTRRQRL